MDATVKQDVQAVLTYDQHMGFPVPPPTPVLLIALEPLTRSSWAGRLPGISIGDPFWSNSREAPGLIAAGQAETAPPGTVAPPAEPAWTAHGQPGFGAGTSNCSHQWQPSAGGTVDGGAQAGPEAVQDRDGTVDGGAQAAGTPAGTVDGGNSA